MNIPSQDIAEMLEAESSLGLVSEFSHPSDVSLINLFIGKEPKEPIDCVTVYDTAGYPHDLNLDGSSGLQRPSIYIRVRNSDYIIGMELAQSIESVLHGRAQQTWNATLYSAIICVSGPAHLDWDDNGHPRFFINFNLQRRTA